MVTLSFQFFFTDTYSFGKFGQGYHAQAARQG